jgi:hypothetical protein
MQRPTAALRGSVGESHGAFLTAGRGATDRRQIDAVGVVTERAIESRILAERAVDEIDRARRAADGDEIGLPRAQHNIGEGGLRGQRRKDRR